VLSIARGRPSTKLGLSDKEREDECTRNFFLSLLLGVRVDQIARWEERNVP